MGKSIDKITNVLIFKDDSYWLTIQILTNVAEKDYWIYRIVPQSWELHNGFESPGDAYSYLTSLKEKV